MFMILSLHCHTHTHKNKKNYDFICNQNKVTEKIKISCDEKMQVVVCVWRMLLRV
jgi:hypothetical protein